LKFIKASTISLFAIFTFLVSYYNQQTQINLNLFGFNIVCPIWLIIGVFFLLGLIANEIVCLIDYTNYAKKIKEYKKELKQLKDEVLSLRKLTLKQDE
jgi:uncharacterized integral membrane protein